MLVRIVVVAAAVLALMAAVKDGRALRATGLVGSCTTVGATAAARLEECTPGRLAGAPSLAGHGCSPAGVSGRRAFWRCPPEPAATAAGR